MQLLGPHIFAGGMPQGFRSQPDMLAAVMCAILAQDDSDSTSRLVGHPITHPHGARGAE